MPKPYCRETEKGSIEQEGTEETEDACSQLFSVVSASSCSILPAQSTPMRPRGTSSRPASFGLYLNPAEMWLAVLTSQKGSLQTGGRRGNRGCLFATFLCFLCFLLFNPVWTINAGAGKQPVVQLLSYLLSYPPRRGLPLRRNRECSI